MINLLCPICDRPLTGGVASWNKICRHCAYEASTFEPQINSTTVSGEIDEENREAGLKVVRSTNFRQILEHLRTRLSIGSRLLEVGSAHGWFLIEAKKYFQVVGIEPDKKFAERTIAQGLFVREGYFPDVLLSGERYDAIIFNDVFEHLPSIPDVLRECANRLLPNGLIVINLPSSDGLFFKLAKLLYKINWRGPLERMWQTGLPSPHLHYFNLDNITSLLAKHDFRILERGTLATLTWAGLWRRIGYVGNKAGIVNLLMFPAIAILLLISKFAPSDIVYVSAQVDRV